MFRDFPRTMVFNGVGLCCSFGWWCCLCAGFYSLNGTSVMESVVLRYGPVTVPLVLVSESNHGLVLF